MRHALVVACVLSLAGCMGDGTAPEADVGVGRQQAVVVDPDAGNTPALEDDKTSAKRHFRESHFGLAEKRFRAAVERNPNDVEAWLGLAASLDQLRRFDLADRAYARVEKKIGRGFELLNNRGYSYMLRGEYARARRDFTAAARLEPDNEFVRNNLRELDEKAAGRA